MDDSVRSALQNAVTAAAAECPAVGRRVRVARGRRHLGVEGVVVWHGRDTYSHAGRYGSDLGNVLREARGVYGFRVGILAANGQQVFVSAEHVDIMPAAAAGVQAGE